MKMQNDNNRKCEAVKMKKCEDEKIRRCADVKMFEDVQSKPPLLEEPFAQTLPGIKKKGFKKKKTRLYPLQNHDIKCFIGKVDPCHFYTGKGTDYVWIVEWKLRSMTDEV